MKKVLYVVLMVFLLLLSCSALASQEMANPYFQEANHMPDVPMTYSLRSANRITVGLSIAQEPSLTQDTIFSATASGGNGGYEYCFYLLDPNDTSDEYPTGNPHGFRSASSVSTFNYRLVVPGTYSVIVYARDNLDDNWDAAATLTFTLEAPDALTTYDVISILVEECASAGCDTDFEKALWFHDWLTNNACYDTTYAYYSADGVLIRGSGVCDSYSKAYLKLLEAVGITAVRVTNVDHAWNLVKLDGEWYHIDPTWDDPVVSGKESYKVSGAEYHMYFGLPDWIMKLDRTFASYSSAIAAEGIDYNYYLMSGKVDNWTETLADQIQSGLSSKGYSFDLNLPSYYQLESGNYSRGKEHVVYNIAAYDMSRSSWAYNSQKLPMTFAYNSTNKVYSAAINFSGATLELPAALSSIGDAAFKGTAKYMEVKLPSGVTSIGPEAFADNGRLWKINIPSSVTSIADNAFSGSDNVTIICPSGSTAEAFAKANAIMYRNN